MVPSSFAQSNAVLDKPKDLTYDQCDVLTIWRGNLTNQLPAIISCWKLTEQELEEIKRTGRIWLVVLGPTMPAVDLRAISPFSSWDESE